MYMRYDGTAEWYLSLNRWNIMNTSTQLSVLFVDNIHMNLNNIWATDNDQLIAYYKSSSNMQSYNYSVFNSNFVNNNDAIFEFDDGVIRQNAFQFHSVGTMYERNGRGVVTAIRIDGDNTLQTSINFENCAFINANIEWPLLDIVSSNQFENQSVIQFDNIIFQNNLCHSAMMNFEGMLVEFNNISFENNTDCTLHFGALSIVKAAESIMMSNIGTIFNLQHALQFDLINTEISNHIGNILTHTANELHSDRHRFVGLIRNCNFSNISSTEEYGAMFIQDTCTGLAAMNLSIVGSTFEDNTNATFLNVIGTDSDYVDIFDECPDIDSYSILINACQFRRNSISTLSNLSLISLSWSQIYVTHSNFEDNTGYNAAFKNSLSSLSLDAKNQFRDQHSSANPIIYVNEEPFTSAIGFSICVNIDYLNQTQYIQTNGDMDDTKVKFDCVKETNLSEYGQTRYQQIVYEINNNYTKYQNKSDDTLQNLESAAMALGAYNCSQETKFCFIQCFSQISCFGANFGLGSTDSNYLLCGDFFSCSNAVIYASTPSSKASILCNEESACQNAKIYVDNLHSVTIECKERIACYFMDLIATTTQNIIITCYNKDACFDLTVVTDTNSINFSIYHYSSNVEIYTPSGYTANEFNCNPNDVHFYYDGYSSFENTLRTKTYNGDETKLPCEDILVIATEISKNITVDESECKFTPKFDKNIALESEINLYAKPYFE